MLRRHQAQSLNASRMRIARLGSAIGEVLDGAPGYEVAGVDVLGEGRNHRVIADGVLGRENRRVPEYFENLGRDGFHQRPSDRVFHGYPFRRFRFLPRRRDLIVRCGQDDSMDAPEK